MQKKNEILALSDEELLRRYIAASEGFYLEELFGRYIRFVFLVCMKYLKNEENARDMMMEVFEKVISDIRRFEINYFKSWLYMVTKNACLMQLRTNKKTIPLYIAEKKEVGAFMENEPSMHLINDNHEMTLEQLGEALGTLEEGQKECVELFYLKEMSYKEVCDQTGYSMNEVKSHIQNGKRNLKNYLLKYGEIGLWLFILLIEKGKI